MQALAAAAVLVAGCSGGGEEPCCNEPDGGKPDGGAPIKHELPKLRDLGPGWTKIWPGRGSRCANGDPYAFFVRPGKERESRVLIEFRGGGACWDYDTCSQPGKLYEAFIVDSRFINDETMAEGIHDHNNDANPFKDWTHIYIPYCTGDLHWGDNVVRFDEKPVITIRFNGAVNARVTLEWVYDNIPEPEKVFVTGCSAGAYGAALWSAHIRHQYEKAKIDELGNGGAGIFTKKFLTENYPIWHAQKLYPGWIPGLDPKTVSSLDDLYIRIGSFYRDMSLGELSTQSDKLQVNFFQLMGGGSQEEWSAKMEASFRNIESKTENFRSYIAPGETHCALAKSTLYSMEACGVKAVDWITDRVNDKPVSSVNSNACAGGP